MPLAHAINTTRIHCIEGLTSGHTAAITTRPFRSSLCYSIAMSTAMVFIAKLSEEGITRI
jgi:hypothetical protein